jgi:hypothetical protein
MFSQFYNSSAQTSLAWHQNLSATFEASKEYTLSMDAAMLDTPAPARRWNFGSKDVLRFFCFYDSRETRRILR